MSAKGYRKQTWRITTFTSTSVDREYWKFSFKWPGWLLLRAAAARCHNFENGYPATKESVHYLAKKGPVTIVQRALRTQFHVELHRHFRHLWLLWKQARTRPTVAPDTEGRPRTLDLQMHSVCSNVVQQALLVTRLGRSLPYYAYGLRESHIQRKGRSGNKFWRQIHSKCTSLCAKGNREFKW